MITQKITQLRRQAGLTQQEMADRLNKSLSTYNRLERGETAMTVDDVERISAILGVPIAEILKDVIPEVQQTANRQTLVERMEMEKLFEEIREIKALLSGIRQAAA